MDLDSRVKTLVQRRNMDNLSLPSDTSTNSSFDQNWYKTSSYWEIGYYFSFFLLGISVITVAANVVLLFVLYKDPLKSFRTPLNNFLISLSLTDLVAGLTYEPVSAACYLMANYKHPSTQQCLDCVEKYLSAVTRTVWKMSPLLIFALTVLQFVVVSSPLKHARKVTKKITIFVTSFIWLYSTVFEIVVPTLPDGSQVYSLVTLIDITIHNLFIPSITLVVYIALYREFKRGTARRLAVRSESLQQVNRERRRARSQQNLLKVNLLLVVVLLLCTLPYGGTQLAYLRFGLSSPEFQFIPLATFSLKLMLHTVVFAWRMPQYRTALKIVLNKKTTILSPELRLQGVNAS